MATKARFLRGAGSAAITRVHSHAPETQFDVETLKACRVLRNRPDRFVAFGDQWPGHECGIFLTATSPSMVSSRAWRAKTIEGHDQIHRHETLTKSSLQNAYLR